jgi:uncharacterized protein (TIGR02600 family)
MALVIVLLFLVLMAVLVIALITTTNNEAISARTYQGSVTVKQLEASAVGLVLGQLADGTHSVKVPGQTTDRLAWASQPGLIRTWDDTGAAWKIFKLYSARDMVVSPDNKGRYSVSQALVGEVPPDWPAETAHFTDLNEPAVIPDPTGRIPRAGGHFRAIYPIVDPLAGVEGFSITNPPGYGGAKPTYAQDPDVPTKAGTSSNPAPMPVRWIYVLRDGTFTVPTGSADGGRTAVWKAGAADSPSRENPIAGRIAFWTDDETCKLNLNTASEPTPWDTPRAITIQDLNYGRYQPAQKEYQRFPGHPLTVALSPVFYPGATALSADQKEEIYKLLPRVGTGGTKSGTEEMLAGTTADPTKIAKPIALHEDRLYANVDEFLFRPEMPGNTRVENTVFLADRLRGGRFFLTTNSRAPELTLAGAPRIALWPIPQTASTRTAYDKLAAFCSTIGRGATAYPFYFQRNDSTSPLKDYTLIQRNRELYSYLQQATTRAIPGYGGNFRTKWGPDRDQVLTEIFDYIRCVNLHDSQSGAPKFADIGQVAPIQIGGTQGFGRFFTVSQAGMHFICSQEGSDGSMAGNAAPNNKLDPGERLVNASFLFEPWSPALGFYPIYEKLYFDVQFSADSFQINGTPLEMRAGGSALVNTIGAGWHNNGREHGGSGGLRGPMQAFGGGNYKWISQAKLPGLPSSLTVFGVKVTGNTMTFKGGTATIKIYSTNSADANYLVQTLSIPIPDGTFPVPKLVRTGTDGYRGGAATSNSTWWTFAGRYAGGNLNQVPHAPGDEYVDLKRRWVEHDGFPPGFKIGGIFRDEDVVRTVVPNHGDIRLIAAKQSVPASDFVKVREAEWNSPTDRMLHIFTSPAGSHLLYGFANEPGSRPGGGDRANPLGGTLGGIPGANAGDQLTASALVKYHYARLPEIRPGAGKQFNHWNDYDNGVATWPDGSYINKPDEGNFAATNSPYTYYAWNTLDDSTGNFFSPSRLVPSAGMLGSLPTGVKNNRPWETLLFRPELRQDDANQPHPGTLPPKDHLIMDLFWMPAIEPYAISEPFSTAGKINLNYEIAPFSYIRRATGLHGVLKGEEPLVLPNMASQIYKLWDHETNDHPRLPNDILNQDPQVRADWDKAFKGQAPFDKLRRPIDPVQTLSQADERFTKGDAFRSATEICELHLVRKGEKLADYRSGVFWRDALITGDNTRERPYTNLYGKLTTRSNTFTIHVRAQVLKQSGGPGNKEWNVWHEGRSEPLTEYRGSTLVERYIDPADANLVDFATVANAVADRAWRVRIVSAKKFSP